MSDGLYQPVGDPPPGCTCGPWLGVVPPGPCPYHAQWWSPPAVCPPPPTYFQPLPSAPLPLRLSDEDVERVAQRVRELLNQEKK